MQKENKKSHAYIEGFNPDVTLLRESHQDFLSEIMQFNAGSGYESFNDFIKEDALEYEENGDGVSYVVWNVFYNSCGEETGREIVSYYTLATTSIPYEDRIRLDKEEAEEKGKIFDIQICGIPSVEIKMFAVDKKYQDLFYAYDGEDLPVSAWIIKNIINYAENLIVNVAGFKALFLHAVPNAETFYEKNGFNRMKFNMKPLHSLDSEFTAMYLTLREVHMIYDK